MTAATQSFQIGSARAGSAIVEPSMAKRMLVSPTQSAEAKARKSAASPSRDGEDPDIAGIVPGPQPSPWGDELGDFETDSDTDTGEDE